jgi:hypothetical protein
VLLYAHWHTQDLEASEASTPESRNLRFHHAGCGRFAADGVGIAIKRVLKACEHTVTFKIQMS